MGVWEGKGFFNGFCVLCGVLLAFCMFDLLKSQVILGEGESILKDLLVLAHFEKDAKVRKAGKSSPFPPVCFPSF